MGLKKISYLTITLISFIEPKLWNIGWRCDVPRLMWRMEPNSKILIIFKRNSSIDQLDANTCPMEKMGYMNELNIAKAKIFSMFYLINKYCLK